MSVSPVGASWAAALVEPAHPANSKLIAARDISILRIIVSLDEHT
ncbi:MAG: hypothetical protein ACXW1Y_01000 [Acidimicrobiia bacterium]